MKEIFTLGFSGFSDTSRLTSEETVTRRLKSSEEWRCVIGWVVTEASKDRSTFICCVKQSKMKALRSIET